MISKHLTKEFKDFIRGLSGHLPAVEKMVGAEFPDQTLLQPKAAQTGLQKDTLMLLDEVYRKGLWLKRFHFRGKTALVHSINLLCPHAARLRISGKLQACLIKDQ